MGKVASILFLDVKGAFPSVAVDRLVHNMHMLGIPEEYTEWMTHRLEARQTTLLFDNHQTAQSSLTMASIRATNSQVYAT